MPNRGKPKPDEICFGPEIEPGIRVAKRRCNGQIKHVKVAAVSDGEPIDPGSELATFDEQGRLEDGERWHTITSSYIHGPPQVATPAYRDGYDRIFGRKQEVGQA